MVLFYKKTCFIFLFSLVFCQKNSISYGLNQDHVKRYSFFNLDRSIKLQRSGLSLLNNQNNYNTSNWFYAMGSYNDTWGSDILKTSGARSSRSTSYYPFGNSILSFQSKHHNKYADRNASVYLNILGFNLKKIKTSNSKNYFYGSE